MGRFPPLLENSGNFGWGLLTLPESFGSLKNLKHLYFIICWALVHLRCSFGRLKRLRKLVMFWCDWLEKVSEDFGALESLEELEVHGSAFTNFLRAAEKAMAVCHGWCDGLEELSEDFDALESLAESVLYSPVITKLPSSLGQLKRGRDWLEELPKDFGNLLQSSALKELYVFEGGFR